MTQIGYCIFLDNKELEFRYKGKIFVIEKINADEKTFLLKDISSPILIENFFRFYIIDFFNYVRKNYPEKFNKEIWIKYL